MRTLLCGIIGLAAGSAMLAAVHAEEPLFPAKLNVVPPPIAADPAIPYDYDIVYVRARRSGDQIHKRYYTDFSQPVTMEPGADLMLLHPDGSEELLAEGGRGAITDPFVSFDGRWVYFTRIYMLEGASQWSPPREGADIFKLHLPTRRLVRLTNQQFAPNLGAAAWSGDFRTPADGKTHYDYGVYNMGPCPLPNGRIVFTSNREGFRPARGYPAIALQLFVMDDANADVDPHDRCPNNIRKIGHLNLAGALHPVVLADGRIMFSTLESQGIRSEISWGVWTIHPDGTNWAPLVSAFDPGGAANGFHFQTQLSDGSVVIEEYYNQNNSGFGAYIKLPAAPPTGYPAFGPAFMQSPRNPPWRFGRFYNAKGKWYLMPFKPTGSVSLTPFALNGEGPADPSVYDDERSPRVGKFTHPSAAPDNHLLTIWSPGPVNHQYTFLPQLDGGIYLIPNGQVIEEPAQMRLIKNDPNYNECWPRAVVPYRRIMGVDEPRLLPELANDGSLSAHLPRGTPFGLVGTSSLFKRESYPNGDVPDGQVTAGYAGGNDPWRGLDAFTSHGNGMPLNWHAQGADAGLYSNEEIVAVRILAMEPTTDRHRGHQAGRLFHSHAMERLRILGELPVRKFGVRPAPGRATAPSGEPLDADGNPDTSFLARIPADVAFTFQTLDKDGLVLNMAQTWHQVRPGEIRRDCGGCHAHSQQPTRFETTLAASSDYPIFDLTERVPLLTGKEHDQSGRRWNAADDVGLRNAAGVVTVEYHRDIRPILDRSCVACHTKTNKNPPGQLVLDDETAVSNEHWGSFPGTYYRLALDERAQFGFKPVGYDSWGYPQASRYVRKLQARRSLLIWKVFGKRLDGFWNDDHPSESRPGAGDLEHLGNRLDPKQNAHLADVDFTGSIMPPPEAVAAGKVQRLSDEDRRTLARWIDLGCPIDLDFDAAAPERRGKGWMLDDQRPTLSLQVIPEQGPRIERILVGMHDFYTGLDEASFRVAADAPFAGVSAETNFAGQFQRRSPGVWEWRAPPATAQQRPGKLSVTIRDREGNESCIEQRW